MQAAARIAKDLLTTTPAELDTRALGSLIADVGQLKSWVAAKELKLIAEFDARKGHEQTGDASTERFLGRHGMTRGDACAAATTARHIQDLPETAAALEHGEISPADAMAIGKVKAGTYGERLTRDQESDLVRAAANAVDPEETARRAKEWNRAQAERDGADEAEAAHRSRTATKVPEADGLRGVFARWGADEGAEFWQIWDHFIERRWRDHNPGKDPSTTDLEREHLLADSLLDMARAAWANTAPGRASKPSIRVTIDWNTLVAARLHDGSICRLDDGTPLAPHTVRRLACDGLITPFLFKSPAEILDKGRDERVANRRQIAALIERDGECVIPGCHAPHQYCHAHHMEYWDNGGQTDLDNLVLLCTKHHHLVHEGGWIISRRAGDGLIQLISTTGEVVREGYTRPQQERQQLFERQPGSGP